MDTLVKKIVWKSEPTRGHDYTVLSSSEEYEKRLYPASTWVCTSITGVYQDTAKIEAFRKLQSYVMGQNEAGAQMKMQAPILTRVTPHEGMSFEREFVVSAFLSGDRAAQDPLPTNPDVFIERLPEITVFVRSFQGMACEEKWAYETRQLLQFLSNREDIRTDTYFTAAYDSPFQLVSTRNEVWMLEYNKTKEIELYSQKKQKQKFVQLGSTRLELPNYLTWPLYFILGFIYIVTSIATHALSAFGFVKSNKYSISDCWESCVSYVTQCFSIRSVSNLAMTSVVTSVTTVWKVALGLIKSKCPMF